MAVMGVIKRCCVNPQFYCYSEEAEDTAMVVDEISDDILDQDDTEIKTTLPQPIMPERPSPTTLISSGQPNSDGQRQLAELLTDLLPPSELQP